jgi:hypothetical protein
MPNHTASSTLLSHTVVAVLAGAAGGFLATQLAPTNTDAARPAQSDGLAPATPAAPARVEARPADTAWRGELERELQTLRERVDALELEPAPLAREAVAAAVEPASAAPLAPAAAIEAERLQDSVAEALEAIRSAERQQAAAEQQQRELQRIDERVARLAEPLGLTPAQQADLRTLMLTQRQERDALESLRDQGGDRTAYRSAMEELRKRDDDALARLLTPEQLQAYQAREQERNGDQRGGAARQGGERRTNRGGGGGGAGGG